jgi:phosphoglycerate dehydrogenase-like enzyme
LKVLIYIAWWMVKAWEIPDKHVVELRRRFPEMEFIHEKREEDAARSIESADIAFSSRLSAETLAKSRRLRWLHSSAAAVEGLLPLVELRRRGVIITNSRGIQAIPIAEQVMAGLLALARRLNLTLAAQREKRWIQAELCDTQWPWKLHGKSMTVVGLGTIGTEVARRANAFGVRVAGVRRRPEQAKPEFVDQVFGPDQLREALTGRDILVISAPFVSKTAHIIGAEEIARLNPGAILVNVARSPIVDQGAMIRALESGQLKGAILDVFDKEPLEPASPLWTMPNVIISPHSSGFRETHWDDVIDLFSDNLRRYQKGQPLLNPVDSAEGY